MQAERFVDTILFVVFDFEFDLIILNIQQTMIADSNFMSILPRYSTTEALFLNGFLA